jgi:ABC-2 type transport system ATP-binding protein
MEEAQRLCDRVAVVDHGKLIALGTPGELIASLEAPNVVEFASEPEMAGESLRAIEGVRACRRHGANWLLTVHSLARTVPAILAEVERSGSRLLTLSTHQATLEDVFVSLTGRELRDE